MGGKQLSAGAACGEMCAAWQGRKKGGDGRKRAGGGGGSSEVSGAAVSALNLAETSGCQSGVPEGHMSLLM